MKRMEWKGFVEGSWMNKVDVRDFIQKNYAPYDGNDEFLKGPTEKTKTVWTQATSLLTEELNKGVLSVDTDTVSGVSAFKPGYLDKENELIVGFQADEPLKRIVNPFGGIRMATDAATSYGYDVNEKIVEIFSKYRKTHNQGVFDAYTKEMKLARKAGVVTGLPDAYGRGRIIGDYRRLPLYGSEFLVEEKRKELAHLTGPMLEDTIRLREELTEQINAFKEMEEMALSYGYDIKKPASNAQEAVQLLYFAYLAAIKQQNGAAMSLGRVSTFIDIYLERDILEGVLTEEQAQELIDQFVIKLRLARHLRTPDYNELFAGDPTWITEAIGGMGENGITLVTKSSFRFLHTLTNLGAAPEPNMTVLWSANLPQAFKEFCAKLSIETDSIQYENDDIMRPRFGDDYGIACCVSAMKIGKQMQFFGARANLGKALLYSINGGRDEVLGLQVAPKIDLPQGEYLEYNDVVEKFNKVVEWLAGLYVDTMNVIHYMHDKYAYESAMLALHDRDVERLMAFGIAGLSVVADSLSAIKYAKVKPIRNEIGITVDFNIQGEYPKFGNDDDRVDEIAVSIVEKFMAELKKHKTYRGATHTLSILTITSNVVYGKKTGSTPDGRKRGEAFAPGANPMHGRDITGALASLNSVAKIPYSNCMDGVSNTFTVVPESLGKNEEQQISNLVAVLDGYFQQDAHHLNVNVLNRATLEDAMNNPEKYPSLTIRVSGYAVNFNRLSKSQQQEVITRTFHSRM